MDPNACLAALIEAHENGDTETMREHAHNLYEWMTKGGFMPSVTHAQLRELFYIASCVND